MPSVQVCQKKDTNRLPAGSNDTSFSVDSSGNVVISYGAIKDISGYTRYPNTVYIIWRSDRQCYSSLYKVFSCSVYSVQGCYVKIDFIK